MAGARFGGAADITKIVEAFVSRASRRLWWLASRRWLGLFFGVFVPRLIFGDRQSPCGGPGREPAHSVTMHFRISKQLPALKKASCRRRHTWQRSVEGVAVAAEAACAGARGDLLCVRLDSVVDLGWSFGAREM